MSEREKQLFHTVMCKNTNSYSPEETSVFHVLCVFIIRFLRTNADPEEVLWLLPFINHLGDTLMMVLWLHFHCWRHTIFFREFKREANASISHKWVSHFLYDHFYPHTCRAAWGGGGTVKSGHKQVFGGKSQSDDAVKFHHCRGDVWSSLRKIKDSLSCFLARMDFVLSNDS